MFDADPKALEHAARTKAVEARIAELMGVINSAHGELVSIAGAVVDEKLGLGPGVHSPAMYLAWKAGLSPSRAQDIVRLAKRRAELPTCTAALEAGSLTLDQAAEIARHVPAAYEADATETGQLMTVRQLRRTLPRFGFVDDEASKPPERPKPQEEAREVSMGVDEKSWWLHARLPADEGAIVEQAIKAMRDDVFRQRSATIPSGETAHATSADGLVCAAEAALRAGEAQHPGTDRYLVHAHLEEDAGAPGKGMLSLHLGPRLPASLQALLLCDAKTRLVIQRDGVPLNVGRTTRVIGRRMRRLIEHRDGGCAVPGCGATTGLDIHHIVHWEDFGPTDTQNLVALCRRHHRMHHLGALGVAGDADLPRPGEGALTFTDRFGREMDSCGRPIPIRPKHDCSRAAATDRGVITPTYVPPLNERLDTSGFHLNFRDPRPPRPNLWVDSPPSDAGPDATTSPPQDASPPSRQAQRQRRRTPLEDASVRPAGPTRAGPP